MVGELQPEDPRSVGPYRLLGRLGLRADGQPDPLTATPTEILEPFDRRDRDGL
jgi:hypothetical protein